MDETSLIRRLERADALNAVALARALGGQDPSWGTETHPVAGGHLVLCGQGLYVNRAIATGISEPLRTKDVDFVVARSEARGVPPEIEVTSVTHPESLTALTACGLVRDPDAGTSVHVHPLDRAVNHQPQPDIQIVRVSERSIEQWQEVCAAGWGHDTAAGRRAADAFARAAHAVDGDGMVLALDAAGGRLLGCASLTIQEDVATLGGMSTLPAERRRGVQAALVVHRLRVARDAGCAVAMTATRVGGDSERNVRRLGFRTTHLKWTYSQRPR